MIASLNKQNKYINYIDFLGNKYDKHTVKSSLIDFCMYNINYYIPVYL